jgi:hypothetical protein
LNRADSNKGCGRGQQDTARYFELSAHPRKTFFLAATTSRRIVTPRDHKVFGSPPVYRPDYFDFAREHFRECNCNQRQAISDLARVWCKSDRSPNGGSHLSIH